MLNRHAMVNRLGAVFCAGFMGLAQMQSMEVSTSQARGKPDVGNMIGNDAVRVQQNLFSISMMPGAMLQLIGGVVVLVYTIGVAGVIGLASMFLCLMVNTRLSQLAKWQEKQNLERTDFRMSVMSQIIHGIRAIKFCAWEDRFSKVVNEARAAECVPLKRYRVLNQGTVQIGRANPMMGTVFAFLYLAVSARNDPNSFRPADIFAALNVFLSLRTGLIILPEGLIYIATTKVSLRRLQDFLQIPKAACHQVSGRSDQQESPNAIVVKSAVFEWPAASSSERVADADAEVEPEGQEPAERSGDHRRTASMGPGEPLTIDSLEVRRGSFTAVVGNVGSGKSSLIAALLGEMPKSRAADVNLNFDVAIFAEALGIVPQKAFILSGTVRDNIAF
eukprot:CAMPEP_0115062208 /NCGR_PEP_ID=MMETSP0227-20121206/8415_1 /TAXON_ID=89957 /ORGANISM="Polarella glacialis, Strain CCMP 1383" /LENGTH=389 /DNA_ID=CAMNT_0002447555 /DNA_START=259 /DNA_END=1426 /DNA_ORIENTATION=+